MNINELLTDYINSEFLHGKKISLFNISEVIILQQYQLLFLKRSRCERRRGAVNGRSRDGSVTGEPGGVKYGGECGGGLGGEGLWDRWGDWAAGGYSEGGTGWEAGRSG